MSERWTCATGICQRICKAHVFDETFGVNSAFNAEVFVAAPHAVAMEFDLFGERRSSHWVKGGGSAKGNFWLDSAVGQRAGYLLPAIADSPEDIVCRINTPDIGSAPDRDLLQRTGYLLPAIAD